MGRRIQPPDPEKTTYGLDEIDFGSGQEAVLRRTCLKEILRLRRVAGWVDARGFRHCHTVPRFVYYRMVAAKVVLKDSQCLVRVGINPRTGNPYKTAKLSSDLVSKALTWLREQGWVYDDEIGDESRSTVNNVGYASVRDGLLEIVPRIRIDPWDGNPPVLGVESGSLKSFFSVMGRAYRIAVVTLGGQASRSYLANDVPTHLNEKTLVLYVGDYDKAGHDIEDSAEARLRVLAPDWCGEWSRVAVTNGQFQEYGVRQQLAIIKTDDRFSPPREFETLEAEGVEQSVLEASVRDVLDALLPVSLDDIRAEEERQQAVATGRMKRWGPL